MVNLTKPSSSKGLIQNAIKNIPQFCSVTVQLPVDQYVLFGYSFLNSFRHSELICNVK